MNSPQIKTLLFIALSSILMACNMTSPNNTTELKAKLRADLDNLVHNLPAADTGLPYSSPAAVTAIDTRMFQAQGLPAWATLNEHDGRLYGTPDEDDAGTSIITLYLTEGELTVAKKAQLTVRHSASYKTSNAIGFYDQQFGGAERLLRNDLSDSLTDELQGEVQFMQSHNVRPKHNFQRDAGDETQSIYNPKLVALRDALLFFTPTNASAVNHIDAVISINNELQTIIPMRHPNDTYAADYHGSEDVVFSNHAWSATLPWYLVKQGLSIRFMVNQHSATEQSGYLAAADIDIGEASQVIFQSIRLGMLTHVDIKSGHYTLNHPILAATDYFQTIPTSRLIMASYADMQLDKVIVRSGAIYDEVSPTTGSYYAGDMRADVAKSQVSIGINLANSGISSNSMNQNYPHLFKQTTIHHAWGNYENGRVPHGLSGGNGIATLVDSRGNEASHEWGHGYGLGHYPGANLTEDQRFKAHHSDSGWGYIAHRKRLRDNLIDNAESAELKPATFHLKGRIPYGRDAMSGGSANTQLSAYTHHTAYSARHIQNHIEKYPIPTRDFASGYKKWHSELGQYQEFHYPEAQNRLAAKEVGVAVATILGGYDPDGNNAVIYPVFHGNYGNVFELPEPDLSLSENGDLVDQCWLTINNALGEEKLVSLPSQRHHSNSINQLHINVNAQFRPTQASLNCRRAGAVVELTHTTFDGLIPDLPAVAIVGQDAEFKQLMAIELTELNNIFASQAKADLVTLTSQQQAQLASYSETDVKRYFSAAAYAAYQKYSSIHKAIEALEGLLAKLNKAGASELEQAHKVKEYLSKHDELATSIDLPTQGEVITGPRYFSMVTSDSLITPIETEANASHWLLSSQGRIHLAEQPWLCLMPGSGGLMVKGCNSNNGYQLWSYTEQSTLKNQASDQCIDYASHNGSLIMYACHNNWNQQWRLPAISDNKLLRLLDAHLIQRLYDLLVDEV